MSKDSEEINQLKKLDKNSFIEAIYNQYGKKLYGYAIVNWNVTEDTAWELIYKTLYKILDCCPNYTFESREKFASFIFKIFINQLRNYYRDNKPQREFEFSTMQGNELSIPDVKESTDHSNQKLKALNDVLDEMEDWERMLLLMRSEGRAYSEISGYIDKPEKQLKVYYQRLKEKLAKKLNGTELHIR